MALLLAILAVVILVLFVKLARDRVQRDIEALPGALDFDAELEAEVDEPLGAVTPRPLAENGGFDFSSLGALLTEEPDDVA